MAAAAGPGPRARRGRASLSDFESESDRDAAGTVRQESLRSAAEPVGRCRADSRRAAQAPVGHGTPSQARLSQYIELSHWHWHGDHHQCPSRGGVRRRPVAQWRRAGPEGRACAGPEP